MQKATGIDQKEYQVLEIQPELDLMEMAREHLLLQLETGPKEQELELESEQMEMPALVKVMETTMMMEHMVLELEPK